MVHNHRVNSLRDSADASSTSGSLTATRDTVDTLSPARVVGVSVMIVDDHELVRAGMRRLLEDTGMIASVAEVACGESAIEAVASQRFDIILMDLSLPGMSGVEASMTLLRHHPEANIIVITASMDGAYTRRLLSCGVMGYLTKDCSPEQMSHAIEQVLQGDVFIAPSIMEKIYLQGTREDAASPFELLSRREMEISLMLLNGQRNRQIGEQLFISEKTVSTHRTRAFLKLGISNTAELARLAMQHGLWNSGPS